MMLEQSLEMAVAGMKAQGARLRVIAENIANAESLGDTPGADPYRRKVITFKNVLDRTLGAEIVSVGRVRPDMSDFRLTYEPEHPAADENGYVKMPNVNALVEIMDMREAQRSYEANLNMLEVSKSMLARTVDLLR